MWRDAELAGIAIEQVGEPRPPDKSVTELIGSCDQIRRFGTESLEDHRQGVSEFEGGGQSGVRGDSCAVIMCANGVQRVFREASGQPIRGQETVALGSGPRPFEIDIVQETGCRPKLPILGEGIGQSFQYKSDTARMPGTLGLAQMPDEFSFCFGPRQHQFSRRRAPA